MKTKRLLAWLLVCVLQLGVCLVIPLHGRQAEQQLLQNGEAYRFAVRAVTIDTRRNRHRVNLDFPEVLPAPSYLLDTTIHVLETGEDGLTRVREKNLSFDALEQMKKPDGTYPDPMLAGVYGCDATLFVSDVVCRDLDRLAKIMQTLYTFRYDPAATSPAVFRSLNEEADTIETEALRTLAQRQIEANSGDELFDSYVTGIVLDDEIYLRDVYVAGTRIASLHS